MADAPAGLWERILEALECENPSQVARKLGLAKQSVYEWQDGKAPALKTLTTIAESGGVSLDWLILGREPKKPLAVRVKEIEADLSPEDREFAERLLSVLGKTLGKES